MLKMKNRKGSSGTALLIVMASSILTLMIDEIFLDDLIVNFIKGLF